MSNDQCRQIAAAFAQHFIQTANSNPQALIGLYVCRYFIQ